MDKNTASFHFFFFVSPFLSLYYYMHFPNSSSVAFSSSFSLNLDDDDNGITFSNFQYFIYIIDGWMDGIREDIMDFFASLEKDFFFLSI
jgi:hypothetical protein